MSNQDLPISQFVLATEVDGSEILPFAKDNANGGLLVSLLMAAFRDGLATQAAVNGKQNKLVPGYGIEITAENEIRTNLDVSPFKIVTELPTADIENKIYLVSDPDGDVGKNEYIEYLWVNNHWEVVGKYTASVDLVPYLKSADAEKMYAKKSDIPDTSGFVLSSVVNTLAEQVAALTTQLTAVKNKLDTIPTMPLSDGKVYAVCDGAWTVIADVTENVVTIEKETEELSDNSQD